MKRKIWMTLTALALAVMSLMAQSNTLSYALIDMQYILSQIPEHKSAIEEIEKRTNQMTSELEALNEKAKALYIDYQKSANSLSQVERVARENEIVKVEDEALQLQEKYFGREGEVMALQKKLIQPIQDKIYEAVKLISQRRGYGIVFDRASTVGSIIYANPAADISNDVLAVLGYSN